jgi:hypothetical protein
MATLLAGCTLLQPQPMREPPHAQGMADDTAPIGPVVELGEGQTERGEFRYVVWESQMGACMKVEFADGDGPISCGGSLELGHEVVSLSSFGGGIGGWDVEGLASDEVAELWLDTANGARVAVPLLSLAKAGQDGQVFYMAVREEKRPIRLIGLDAAGAVIAEVAIPTP